MLGWLPDRVASFITKNTSSSTLIGIDENTALVHTDAWRKYGSGKVHILRGELSIED
jgi:cyanophycinase